ncbi:hypothetical protein H2203_001242 [Taxawa tesnikishii (nom. ined.)]|nr:hypothetical protein H2203_001242 [Dothideales sp. JES 119]
MYTNFNPTAIAPSCRPASKAARQASASTSSPISSKSRADLLSEVTAYIQQWSRASRRKALAPSSLSVQYGRPERKDGGDKEDPDHRWYREACRQLERRFEEDRAALAKEAQSAFADWKQDLQRQEREIVALEEQLQQEMAAHSFLRDSAEIADLPDHIDSSIEEIWEGREALREENQNFEQEVRDIEPYLDRRANGLRLQGMRVIEQERINRKIQRHRALRNITDRWENQNNIGLGRMWLWMSGVRGAGGSED